jgi:hypothetical protein
MPEDYGMYIPVTVTAKPYDYQVMSQTTSGNANNFVAGSSMTASVVLKNTGRQTWPVGGANPVRLGTSRPQERSSAFSILTGTDAWLTATRASGIDARVTALSPLTTVADTEIAPGEMGLFRFTLKAPTQAGTYKEYFNLLAEGQLWLPDYGLYLPLTVTSAPTPSPTP